MQYWRALCWDTGERGYVRMGERAEQEDVIQYTVYSIISCHGDGL